jgi:hypothetical protein
MTLPTVFETCEPREDVLSGTVAEADFAADLAKVIRGTASDDYKIPVPVLNTIQLSRHTAATGSSA